eukprot:1712115-Rhodomonas_salina.5
MEVGGQCPQTLNLEPDTACLVPWTCTLFLLLADARGLCLGISGVRGQCPPTPLVDRQGLFPANTVILNYRGLLAMPPYN